MKAKKNIDRDQYVVKSNELIRHSRYNLSVQQQRIVLYAISKIRPEDTANTWYEFNIKDMCKACGIDDKNGYYYKSIKEDVKHLMQREFGVMPDGAEISISWIGDVKMYHDNGTIQLCFNPNMQPYLFELRDRYTQYKLENVLAFKKSSTIKLYELLRSYVTQQMLDNNIKKSVEIPLDELRKRLDFDGTYQEWHDFDRFIIRKGIEEINMTNEDMHVDYKAVRSGRCIGSVLFTIGAPSPQEMWAAHEEKKRRLDRKKEKDNSVF